KDARTRPMLLAALIFILFFPFYSNWKPCTLLTFLSTMCFRLWLPSPVENSKISDHITDLMFAPHPTGSVFENNVDNKTYMKWQPVIGENYSEKERAIVIPVTGFYFVYAHFALRCHDKDEGFKRFSVQLHRRPFGYNDNVSLTDFRDAIKCSSEPYRNIFVGQLFELEREDQVKVWLREDHLGVAEEGKSFLTIQLHEEIRPS
uniref:THD domain-containing protein n=1 Tax=Acanthochromis polyacanthus TaxID=80966 RepID=A0A3Q1FC66_9TELE